MRKRVPGWVRAGMLAAVLTLTVIAVPDSAVRPIEVALVKVERASGLDVSPRVIWILAVGSDARPGEDMTRSRGDALQLIGINTETGAACAIGIPRDSWVSIPGHGTGKINEALYDGGPTLMARAVADLIGITPDYVLVTRFEYFVAMVDSIGGIDVHNPRFFDDYYLKPKGFERGPLHLTGTGALAFSRIRKSLPLGDFDRSANQQRTLRGIQAAIATHAEEPGFMERGVLSVMQHTSTNAPPGELFAIAQAVAAVEPSKVTTCVLQGGVGYVGEASVVFPDRAMATRLGNQARDDATLTC